MALTAVEFTRRFLLHTLPSGFVRIRHYGLLGNRCRRAKLARCRTLLAQPAPEPVADPESAEAMMLRLTGIDLHRCPHCHKGRLRLVMVLGPNTPGTLTPRATGPPYRAVA
jgi:hypothetical protein